MDTIKSIIRNIARSSNSRLWYLISQYQKADISFFHDFRPPPAGGGHQFLHALWKELRHLGYSLEKNKISPSTQACLFNSYNFDFNRLRLFRHIGCRMIHRVDGPISVYRGWDDKTDQQIRMVNRELADVTIFQSQYSLKKHIELGLDLNNPIVIMNSVDPSIFHSKSRISFTQNRKIKLISTSWSDNENKGFATYKWLEDHIDWNQFDYTFIGRAPIQFEKIHLISPIPSHILADHLRNHDIFITASKHEACSNALIEALSCGLPAIYLISGGNPEIVREAGLGFEEQNQIPALLTKLVDEYEIRQKKISIPSIAEVTHAYLNAMGLNKAS